MNAQSKFERFKNLSPKERALLLKKIQESKKTAKKKYEFKIPQYPRGGIIPLSTIQKQIWFYEHVIPDCNAFNIALAMNIKGKLNFHALIQTINEMGRRHEILRTTFHMGDEEPYQSISEAADIKLYIVDFAEVKEQENSSIEESSIFGGAKKSFDLTKSPPLRFVLYHLGKSEYILLLVMNHILCDNWSLTLFIRELLPVYYSFVKGEPFPPRKLNIQYADYCLWEQELMEKKETQEKIIALKEKLKGRLYQLNLPVDIERESSEGSKGKSRQFIFEQDIVTGVRRLCKTGIITPYILFLTIYNALLYRYTRQKDISIGINFINRPPTGEETLLGPFVNVALIQTRFDENTSFSELLNQIRTAVLDLHTYAHIPAIRIIRELQPRSQNQDMLSLMQVFYGFLNFQTGQWAISPPTDFSIEMMFQSNEMRTYNYAKFELDLTMWEEDERMGGNLEYRSDLFYDDTITRMLEHYRLLLKALLSDQDQDIHNVKLYKEEDIPTELIKEADFQF